MNDSHLLDEYKRLQQAWQDAVVALTVHVGVLREALPIKVGDVLDRPGRVGQRMTVTEICFLREHGWPATPLWHVRGVQNKKDGTAGKLYAGFIYPLPE